MHIRIINQLYFSPVFSTRQIVRIIGGELAHKLCQNQSVEYDLLEPHSVQVKFGDNDLVVIGIPVFGGRVPGLALKHLENFSGANTPAILVASFGNRAVEDALLELHDKITTLGFKPLAAASCVAQHTIAPTIASGRPDEADIESMEIFADKIAEAIGASKTETGPNLPGNRPYRNYIPKPLPQTVDQNCMFCGLCSKECPSGAISFQNPASVDLEKCFCCMRCVNICPAKARHPREEFITAVTKMLDSVAGEPRQNAYYYPDSI